jgi:hypothetical protein
MGEGEGFLASTSDFFYASIILNFAKQRKEEGKNKETEPRR